MKCIFILNYVVLKCDYSMIEIEWYPGRRPAELGLPKHNPEDKAESPEHLENSRRNALDQWSKGQDAGVNRAGEELRRVSAGTLTFTALLNWYKRTRK